MKIETKCLHEGYTPANGEPLTLPIYQSTTYKYESTAQVAKLFDLTDDGHMYSRISNPTVAAVEEKIAALEGGVGALCTTSGQAATLICILNILRAGDHILCASTIYGGTINLFAVTLKRFGIEVSFVDADADEQTLCSQIQPNTKAVFAETIANPAIAVLDIEKMARVAHSRGIPLIVDNTFATPVLCRPFEYGADIVVHSTTKYMDGHATQLGGVIVDSGNFDWTNGNFPEFTEPDQSYHGVVYTRDFGRAAYIFCAGCLFAQSWAGNAAPADGAPLSECRSGRSLFAAAQQGGIGQLPDAGRGPISSAGTEVSAERMQRRHLLLADRRQGGGCALYRQPEAGFAGGSCCRCPHPGAAPGKLDPPSADR